MRRYKLELYNEINEALERGNNICIIHPYRTGSTSLGLNIYKFFNIPYFDEINHDTHPGQFGPNVVLNRPFDIKILYRQPCVYKISIGNIHLVPNNILNTSSFNIVLKRRNFNLQVASFLMAQQDDKFHSFETGKLDDDGFDYDISREKLEIMINKVKDWNEKCTEIKYDRQCYYEDLVSNHVLEPLEKVKKLEKDPAVIRKIICALKKLESESIDKH